MVGYETMTEFPSSLQRQRLSNHQELNHGASFPLHFSSPAEYGKALHALYQRERDSAFDAAAISNASVTERDAAAILEAIRQKERSRLQPVATDHFLGYVDDINSGSDLMLVSQQLPKGSHLHCHFNTYLHPSFLISQARHVECMFIRSSLSLDSPQKFKDAAITFSVLPKSTEKFNIFDRHYKPFGWMQYFKFLEKFPRKMGDAETWLAEKMVITEEKAHATDQTFDGVWDLFNRSTQMMKGLFNYESAFRNYVGEAIQTFLDDKVMYAEVRPNFFDKFIVSDDGERQLDHTVWMQIIQEQIDLKIQELERSGMREFFHGIKVIYCAPRSIQKKDMIWCLKDCISLKQEFPDLICGFDMVGCEGRGNPIRFYIQELLDFRKECSVLGLDIPFIFHAGETLESNGPTDGNLFDAILLGSKRIGHGYALPRHPMLMQICREKGIALEICPISNEILHLCPSIQAHVLPILLSQSIPCTINSDNPAYFSSSLSHEFYQIMFAFDSMSLHGWRVLAEWSLEHSCMDAKEKVRATSFWGLQWDSFCEWIVKQFGAKYERSPVSHVERGKLDTVAQV